MTDPHRAPAEPADPPADDTADATAGEVALPADPPAGDTAEATTGETDEAPAGDAPSDDAPAIDAPAATAAPTETVDLDEIERDLDAVQAALDRLNDGTYWTDEVTGEALPDEVLRDDPTARTAAGG